MRTLVAYVTSPACPLTRRLLSFAPCRSRSHAIRSLQETGQTLRHDAAAIHDAAGARDAPDGTDSFSGRREVRKRHGGEGSLLLWTLSDDGRSIGILEGGIDGEGGANHHVAPLSGVTAHLTGISFLGAKLYGVANGDDLYEINRETGRTTSRKLGCSNCGGASFSLFSVVATGDGGEMFASGLRARRGGTVAGLFRLDPVTGEVEWVARHRQTGILLDLAVDRSRLYGVSFENRLFEITTAGTWSGEATAVGEIDGTSGITSGISFVDGVLYAIDYGEPSKLYTVDLHPHEGRCRATEVGPGNTGLDLSHVLTSSQELG